MALKKLSPMHITEMAYEKARTMYRHEAVSYTGAYLTSVRTAMLPYLQNNISLDSEKEEEIMRTCYDEVNEFYQDEHMLMTSADLLE